MISEKITQFTLERIYAIYWDAPCRYKDRSLGKWRKGRIGVNTMEAIGRRECVILLKPLNKITLNVLQKLSDIIGEPFNYNEVEENFESFVNDFVENIDMASYIAVDMLRRSGYCVNVYGLDLFKSHIAEEIDTSKWKTHKDKKKPYIPKPFAPDVPPLHDDNLAVYLDSQIPVPPTRFPDDDDDDLRL